MKRVTFAPDSIERTGVADTFQEVDHVLAPLLVPPRLVGQDRRTGSIKVGKVADLLLVEGDPSVRIGDLRHTRMG